MSGELAAELGFSSNLSHEKERTLHLQTGYTGQEAVEHLATVTDVEQLRQHRINGKLQYLTWVFRVAKKNV